MANKFKVGDQVRVLPSNGNYSGLMGTVKELGSNATGSEYVKITGEGIHMIGIYEKDLELISNNAYENMTLFEKIVLAGKKEPEKSFIKAGISKMDGTLTPEGQTAFLGWLLEKNGDAFKKEVCDPILALDEKETK